ncbi:MAG: hypothetical protein ABI852_04400 [Gemmatimonadaceae bacterium]
MLNWILILGGCGLVAGIAGPIKLNPQFQMGPLVGVFITGPLGLILGVAGYFISRWLHVPMATQWRVILAMSVLLVTGTILSSFPGSEFKAYIINSVVTQCRPVNALHDDLLIQWQERVDNIKSTEPRTGWKEQMSATLQSANGVVVDARILHRTEIREQRKPWNRGTLISVDRTKPDETTSYFDDSVGASCAKYASGMQLEAYVNYGTSSYSPPDENWPPIVVDRIVMHGRLFPVPTEFRRFAWAPSRQ